MITATRYHDISVGHRVVGHENKCRLLHGHNYRIHFMCAGDLDEIGRVIDFGVIKLRLCFWLEENWDHCFLLWSEDKYREKMEQIPGVKIVPFNPTAENMANYLLHTVSPARLANTGVRVIKVEIEETRKCSAAATLES